MRDNVSEALRILLFRRWYFFVPFCLASAGAAVFSHLIPRTYTASTVFERVDDDVLQNLPIREGVGSFIPFRQTLARDIKSPEIMSDVVEALGLTAGLPKDAHGSLSPEGHKKRQAIGDRLAAGVKVSFLGASEHQDTVKLEYTGPDSGIAARLIDEIKNAYIRDTRCRITQKLVEGKAYFDAEADERRAIMDEIEDRMVRRRMESPALDPTDPDVLFIKLTSLRNEERELERQCAALRSKLDHGTQFIESLLADHAASANAAASLHGPIRDDPRVQAIRRQIETIDGQIDELRLKRQMTDNHPDICELRQLRGHYVNLLSEGHDPGYTAANQGIGLGAPGSLSPLGEVWRAEKLRAEADLAADREELERLQSCLRVVQADAESLEQVRENVPTNRAEYRQLQGDLHAAREDLNLYSRTAATFSLILAADESERGIRFNELEPARGGTSPSSPKAGAILALALLIGAAAGGLGVLLAELFDQSFHAGRQVARSLGLSILESIGEIVTTADRARQFRRRFIVVPAATFALLGAMGLSGALAYLSLERPWTYQRLIQMPRNAWQRLGGAPIGQPASDDTPAHASLTEIASAAGS